MITYNSVFSIIIKKIIRPENNVFSPKYDNTDPINLIYKAFFGTYDNLHLKENIKVPYYINKFVFLQEGLNMFIIKDKKEDELLFFFYKIQKVYHTLNRFIYNYKYKRAKIVVNTDMELNEIKENDKNIITIYQEKAKYLFKIYDLLKIINISLSNSHLFFAEPLCIKNPYNNLPFGKDILYYIHYYLTEKVNLTYKIELIDLFLKFHLCEFNLTLFLSKYEYLLREHSIKNHIKNSEQKYLHNEIIEMINLFNAEKPKNEKIIIHHNFPKDKLIHIFKPYLQLYISSKYLLIPILKRKASYELNKKLYRFQKFNPNFGRFIILHKKKYINNVVKIYKKIKTYNDNCIPFKKYNNNNFLKDHLSFTYKHYLNGNTIIVDLFEDSSDEQEEEEEEEEQEEEQQEEDF
jgi:hypothetical protein